MDVGLDKIARDQLLNKLRLGYVQLPRNKKIEAVRTLMTVAGYSRKGATRALNRPALDVPVQRRKRVRQSRYESVLPAIRSIWAASNHLCGSRLKAAIPLYLERMTRSGELRLDRPRCALLLSVSVATLDRLLAPDRKKLGLRGRCTTKPGSLASSPPIPVKTFSEWSDATPGAFAVDWVAFCGGTPKGEYVAVLSMVDIASSWVLYAAFLGRSERFFTLALEAALRTLPFPVHALHVDNDSTFLNHHVLRFCSTHRISMTRTRPYKPNDNCHVEQKNWDVLRKFLGYGRFDTPRHIGLLQRILPLIALYQNLFQPSARLREKTRNGSRVHRAYHPPLTPLQQLRSHPATSSETRAAIDRYDSELSPGKLLKEIHSAIDQLYALPPGPPPP